MLFFVSKKLINVPCYFRAKINLMHDNNSNERAEVKVDKQTLLGREKGERVNEPSFHGDFNFG